ncbi:MAG: tRNA-dihydrouridine synthase [Marinobacter sp.]|nr:tRNA-dihydrouridine synthase [Marinobacter sp.]
MQIFLAPMEGLVDAYVRDYLTRAGGVDRCVTEFIRVTQGELPARVFHKFAPELLAEGNTPSGVPVAVQLLGSDVASMAHHGAMAASLGAPQVDINFGCPAKTVNRHKGGAVLLREPDLMYRLTAAVRQAVPPHIPVTAKMRLGYEDRSMAIACGEALDAAGVSEIAVHARSKVDGYKPPAYWDEVARVRERVKARVIANGEIWTVDQYWRCREQSGCDDIMIGRGLMARPDLARRIKASQLGEPLVPMSWAEAVALLVEYCQSLEAFIETRYATGRIKQWLNYMRQGFDEAEAAWEACKRIREGRALCETLEASAAQSRGHAAFAGGCG